MNISRLSLFSLLVVIMLALSPRASLAGGLISGETFLDDPSLTPGSGIPLVLSGSATDPFQKAAGAIDLTGVEPGSHTIYIRMQDDSGLWSEPVGQTLHVPPGDPDGPFFGGQNKIEMAEVFIDDDPGEGNGIPLATPVDGQIDSTVEKLRTSLNLDNLGLGVHVLHIRFLDSTGIWSPTTKQSFYVPAVGASTPGVSSILTTAIGEIDDGPAIALTADDGAFDDLVETVTLSEPVNNAYHSARIRFVDNQGIWSLNSFDDRLPPSFAGTASLSGQVVEAGTGQPVEGLQVWVGGGHGGVTDSQGFYYIGPFPYGSASIATYKSGYDMFSTTLDFTGPTRLDIAVNRDFSQCSTAGTLYGIVKDGASGKPLEGITVNLGGQTAITTSSGVYSFPSTLSGVQAISVAPQAGYLDYNQSVSHCGDTSHNFPLTKADTTVNFNYGSPWSDDPVNTATGNYTFQRTDFTLPGIGFGFAFKRGYNSQNPQDGPLGYGWTHNFNIKLIDNVDVVIAWGDGSIQTYAADGQGGYAPQPGSNAILTHNVDGSWNLEKKNGLTYKFNAAGILQTISDRNSNTQTLTYTGGLVTEVTDTAGRSITFTYDAENRISMIQDSMPVPRIIKFAYDASGNLVTSADMRGNSTYYTYDADHQMLTAEDPLGHVFVENTYDPLHRVVTSQRDAKMSLTAYEYQVEQQRTKITNPYNQVSYHYYDADKRLVKEEDALGNSSIFVYENGNRVKVMDKNGNVTKYFYDSRGNVTGKVDALGNVTAITYDQMNNPLTRVDAEGNLTQFAYDANGNLIQTIDPLGNDTAASYTANGLPATRTDALGNVTSFTYDGEGNLASVTDPLGNLTAYTYDEAGRRLTRTDALGYVTSWTYDANNNLISETDPLGHITTHVYNANDKLTSTTDKLGNVTAFAYDAKDLLTTVTDAQGNIHSYTYDALDRKISETDANGNTTSNSYDEVGNRLTITDPLGNTTRSAYDAQGNRISVTDPLGNTTTYGYDQGNRLITKSDALGNQTYTEYDPLGRMIEETDPNGNITSYGYDPVGNLVAITDALGNTTTHSYDANGNRLSTTNPLGQTTSFAYDALNRRTTATDPLGNSTTTVYDALGRILVSSNAKGQITRFAYDPLGRLLGVTDPADGVMTYSYDANGNRLSRVDPNGNTTAFMYDELNRRISMTEALGNSTDYGYDAVGNLITKTDPNGITINYTYDANNRRISNNYPDSSVSYSYDANGNLLIMVDSLGATSYTYDAVNRLVGVNDPFGQQISYGYDAASNRVSLTYPGGNTVNYSFDALNRLSSLTDWLGTTTTYSYDATGRLINTINPNNTEVSYSYDSAGRRTALLNERSDGSVIASYSFTLDAIGNHIQVFEEQPLMPIWSPADIDQNFDAENRMNSRDSDTLTYDNNGNLIGQGNDIFAYDFQNRLIASEISGTTSQYRYNGSGERYEVVDDSGATRSVWDLNRNLPVILTDTDATNSPIAYYVYGLGLVSKILPDDSQYVYHFDTRGSTVAITDSTEDIINAYAYDSYGGVQSSQTLVNNQFSFLGRHGIVDDKNGLNYIRARYYKPRIKRFVSKDAKPGTETSPQSWNRYMYALGNPIRLIDVSGFSPDTLTSDKENSELLTQNHSSSEPNLSSKVLSILATALETGQPLKYALPQVVYALAKNRPLTQSLYPYILARSGMKFAVQNELLTVVSTAIEMVESKEYLVNEVNKNPDMSNFEMTQIVTGEIAAVPLNVFKGTIEGLHRTGSLVLSALPGDQKQFDTDSIIIFGSPITKRITGRDVMSVSDGYMDSINHVFSID